MNQFQHFSSLPPEQEAAFLVYEQKQAESLKTGLTIGAICGIAVGALILIISFTVSPAKDPHAAQPAAGSQTQKADK
jgi:hypothetical protein